MGLETQNTKTWDKKSPNLDKETKEENREQQWWVGEKFLNLEKDGKRKTESLDKMTREKTSQPREKTREKNQKREWVPKVPWGGPTGSLQDDR